MDVAGQAKSEQLVLADLMEYHSEPFMVAHPDRMAVLARLAGLTPPRVDNCRVLEIGCGSGVNPLSIAYTFPGTEVLGIDLGRQPIAKANAAVDALGLRNIRFECANLLDFDFGDAKFDYIIAYGLYAWVPPIVQEKLLSVVGQNLSARGVAFINYNVLPGSYSQVRLRELALFHFERLETGRAEPMNPEERVRELRKLLLAIKASPVPAVAPVHLDIYMEAALGVQGEPSLLFHDTLSDWWQPVTVLKFTAHAAKHGLQYLCDAAPACPEETSLEEEISDLARTFASGDAGMERQYFDHLGGRRFRQTLLVRSEHTLSKEDRPDAVRSMFASCHARETLGDEGQSVFDLGETAHLETSDKGIANIVRYLISAWPRRVGFKDFVEMGAPAEDLARLMVSLFRNGLIDLYTVPSACGDAGPRPKASALARYEMTSGAKYITSLLHRPVEMPDDESRRLLSLADGTRPASDFPAERLADFSRLGLLHAAPPARGA